MIFTDRTITVRKGESRIDEPIVVYRGDYELEVRFIILNSRFKFMSGTNMIESEKASYGQLAILTPYGGNIFSDVVRCNDGSVTFTLTAEMLNQIEEVGLYSFQIRLMDYNKESRVSIPPIEFGIEVREPIASEDHDNSVNNAIVGYSIAKVVDPKEENVGDTFDESGNYNKTKWETGDRISEGKLNKIEDAIDKINKNEVNNTAVLSKRIDNNFNVLDSTKVDKNEIFSMANMGQDIKEAMTGGSVAVVGNHSVAKNNVLPNQITHEKLANNVLKFKESNLITDIYPGGFVNWNNGSIQSSDQYSYSNYISIAGCNVIYGRANYHYAFYDSNLKFISGNQGYPNAVQPIEIPVPEGGEFIRVSIQTQIVEHFVLGSTLDFVSYPGSVNTLIIPSTTANGEKIVLEDGMVNTNSLSDKCVTASKTSDEIVKCQISSNRYLAEHLGYFINWDSGVLASNTNYNTSIYIPIKEGDVIHQSINAHYCIYDASYKKIQGFENSKYTDPITAPASSAYIRVSPRIDFEKTYMLTINEEIPDVYEPFHYKLAEIDGNKIISDIPNNSITADKLQSGSITKEKLKDIYVPCVLSTNRFIVGLEDVCVVWTSNGLMDNTNYITSIYIPIKEGDVIYQSINAHYCIYNASYNRVIGHRDTEYSNPITAPASSAYIRVSPVKGNRYSYMLTINEEIPDIYVKAGYVLPDNIDGIPLINNASSDGGYNPLVNSRLYGKKVSWYGTSITQGYGWCQLVNAEFGFKATNNGVGGTAVCKENENSSMCTKNRMLGKYSSVTDQNTGEVTLSGTPIPSDVEIIFIEGGTNDWARNWPIGDEKFNDNPDDQTFAGACHLMFKNMTELFPNAEIIIVGSPFGKLANRSSFTDKYGLLNNEELQTVEYGDVLLDVAGRWGIKGFNMGREMQIHDNNIATIIPDGLHLTTDEAKRRAADSIIAYLLTL